MDEELKLLNIIAGHEKINQRAIAREVGVSLGTINSMLRALEERQYLLISKTANNSARYLLTEDGKNYRSQKLYQYIEECSEMVTRVRTNLKNLLLALVSQGVKDFYLSEKEDELYRIVMLLLIEISHKFPVAYHLTVPAEILESAAILGWKEGNGYQTHPQYVAVIDANFNA